MPGSTWPYRVRKLAAVLFLWIALPVLLVCVAGTGALYLLCAYKPQVVAASVQEYLESSTGMPWRIRGDIAPTLFPFPGVSVSDVAVPAASSEQALLADVARPFVRAGCVRLFLDTSSLWSGSLRFRFIELEEPTVNLAYDSADRPLWSSASGETARPSGERDDPLAALEQFLRKRAGKLAVPVHIHGGSLNRYTEQGRLLLAFSGIEARFVPPLKPDGQAVGGAKRESGLHVAARFRLPGAGLEADLSLSVNLGEEKELARGDLSGVLRMTPPGSRSLAAAFSTPFSWTEPVGTIRLPNLSLTAESDVLSADLTLDPRALRCTGKVRLHKLSLPRWFAFARELPPGLQQPLDALAGEFDLSLHGRTAEARNLRGLAGPVNVRGFVGVADLFSPVVKVDLDLDRVNLDPFFPFLAPVGRTLPEPLSPSFDHPPLAPFPEDRRFVGPGERGIDIGYDVAVRVARPLVHDVDAGALEVLVRPVRVGKADKARVSFQTPRILEGSASGQIDIHERSVIMRYAAKGLKLGLLPENRENPITIDGLLSGSCEIVIPVSEAGAWANDWQLSSDAAIQGCAITKEGGAAWRLFAEKAEAAGKGTIQTVSSRGISINGLWDLKLRGIATSWHPKGGDALSGSFDGGFYWPALPATFSSPGTKGRVIRRVGLERAAGTLAASGSLAIPGTLLPALRGKLSAELDWRLHDETLAMKPAKFTGFGSGVTASGLIDYGESPVSVQADIDGMINPGELFGKGGTLAAGLPKLLKARAAIRGSADDLRVEGIRAELDGAPVSGNIRFTQAHAAKEPATDGGLWTLRLAADHLDIGRFFPSSSGGNTPPSTSPWKLSFLKGMALDAEIVLRNAKKDTLEFAGTTIKATLQRDRFSVHSVTQDFYRGKATALLQGTIVPQRSQVILRKGLLQIQGADFGKLLNAYTHKNAYGGTADLVIDIAGALRSGADIPAKLSGIWSLSIKEGLYPAFFSKKNSRLRNTFDAAAVGGVLDRGVLRWDNFRLAGSMVDMHGEGWVDLNKKDMDIQTSVTFGGIPTVPVRFYGAIAKPRMNVRGVDMVLETVQAAGSSLFGLVRGVFELPGRAVSGIASLFDSSDDE